MDYLNQSYNQLQERYDKIFQANFQYEVEPDPTFLTISGISYYEQVISSWYAFFFNSKERHGLSLLFSDSLTQLINESHQLSIGVTLTRCQVIQERYVNQRRIDLLLFDEANGLGEEQTYRNAIIIENKINAGLYNDFKLYYESIKADESKIGVLLTLYPESKTPDNYLNFTHTQLLDRVMQNLGKYLVKAHEKYLLLLKDFIQEVQSYTKSTTMKELVHFYFDNAQKINELVKIKSQSIEAVLSELRFENSSFLRSRKYPESLGIKYQPDSQVWLLLKLERFFDEGIYETEFWISGAHAQKFNTDIALQNAIRQIQAPGNFTFNKQKTGAQWAYLGKQVSVIERTYDDLKNWPQEYIRYLETHWKPFIEKILNDL